MTPTPDLKAAALAATQGEWKYHKDDNFVHADTANYRMIGIPSSKDVSREQRDANGAFIALANPAAILALIERLQVAEDAAKELTFEIQRVQTALSFWLPRVPDFDGPCTDRIANDAYLLCCLETDETASAQDLGWVLVQEVYEIAAERYRHLRNKDIDTIDKGGVFAGMTPDNLILTGEDLDRAVDAEIAARRLTP